MLNCDWNFRSSYHYQDICVFFFCKCFKPIFLQESLGYLLRWWTLIRLDWGPLIMLITNVCKLDKNSQTNHTYRRAFHDRLHSLAHASKSMAWARQAMATISKLKGIKELKLDSCKKITTKYQNLAHCPPLKITYITW